MIDAAGLSDHDAMLAGVARLVSSVRGGTDSVVLHYWWRRESRDDAGFVQTLQRLVAESMIEINPEQSHCVRLSPAAFEKLRDSPLAAIPAADDAEDDEAGAWTSSVRRDAATPVDELKPVIRQIFALIDTPGRGGLAAGTLSQIWAIERKRGGDLRRVLDAMLADGELSVERGDATVFSLR